MAPTKQLLSRRDILGLSASAIAVGGAASYSAATSIPTSSLVNERTRASKLAITDLRCAVLTGIPMSRVPIIRIDTNQGISGYGEVRDGASPKYALALKSRLLGQNPCDIDRLFRKVKQFGGHGRRGGGVSSIEMALWDLVGKAYDVPAYQLLGGKFRDRIRLYADTPTHRDPSVLAQHLKGRLDQGYTVLKMDVGIDLLEGVPGAVARPGGPRPNLDLKGLFTGAELTPKGIEVLCEYVARAREAVGPEIPLALDHFGPIGVNSCIRLGKGLEKYTPAWLEDMIPWQHTALLRTICDAIDVPILTGEDIYLKEDFERLIDAHAVDLIHPDLATAGGLLETKKIGDRAGEAGIGMVLHHSGGPISFMANVHVAAATETFCSLEFHAADVPGWEDLVDGIAKPIVDRGWVSVPEAPGLGVTPNEEACRSRLQSNSGYFSPTTEWDSPDSYDRDWS